MTAVETEPFLLALLVRFDMREGQPAARPTWDSSASHRWMMVAMAMGL
jgi:hypothetical protein